MKCNNCGINYDDEDRECPICGTRAGAGKRASVPRYTSYMHDTHTKEDCTHQTFTRKFTTAKRTPPVKATRPAGGAPDGKKAGKWIGVAIAVLILLADILPLGLEYVQGKLDDGRYYTAAADAPEPDYEPAFEQERVADLLGTRSTGTTPDGGLLTLLFDTDNDYGLTYANGELLYEETGWAWCVYNDPSEGQYDEMHPPEQYDSYTLCLDFEDASAQGAMAERFAAHQTAGEMWLYVYVPLDGGPAVLYDAYGECAAFFGGAEFLSMQALEQG